MTPPLSPGVTAETVRERLAAVAVKAGPSTPCTAALAVLAAREVDADVADVIRVALADSALPALRLSAELADLGVQVSEGSIQRHRRGLRNGGKGTNGCLCTT